MASRRSCSKGDRKLASLRLDVAKMAATLSSLKAAIREARSDAGLAAVRGISAENKLLLAENLLAVRSACASQAALDIAVMASQTDPLTGLRNRSVLWERLSSELELASRLGQHVAVLLLDIDDFKALNDQRGHATGDLVLQRVAAVLTATVRASDMVCRIGGDEFVVVASTARREDVDQLVRKIESAMREPYELTGQAFQTSVSLGSSVFPEDGSDPMALVNKADQAMYRVKNSRIA